jgi:UDP-N-acetylmuramoyl-tripeptide--D-alanyl-D-alanine ligase
VEHAAEVTATFKLDVHGSELALHTPQGDCALTLQVPGMHNVRNALAAAAAAIALGISLAAIAAGLTHFAGVKGRLQRKPGLHGATLIDDTYNANPGSVRAAIAVLAAAPGKRLLVLGDMGELGPEAAQMHRQIGEQAKHAGVDMLFALGDLSRHAAESFGAGGRHFERIQELLAEVENLLAPDVTVLVKGSRFMQMERVVKSFEVGTEC